MDRDAYGVDNESIRDNYVVVHSLFSINMTGISRTSTLTHLFVYYEKSSKLGYPEDTGQAYDDMGCE